MRRKKIANNTYISLSSKGLFNLNNLILIQMKKNNRYVTQVPTKTGTLDTITQVNLLSPLLSASLYQFNENFILSDDCRTRSSISND